MHGNTEKEKLFVLRIRGAEKGGGGGIVAASHRRVLLPCTFIILSFDDENLGSLSLLFVGCQWNRVENGDLVTESLILRFIYQITRDEVFSQCSFCDGRREIPRT